ncbi:hypothetical protein WA026_001461 [Henosepilachna vigintioctopunctata]|uniref:BAG domain-containing protein n=1 Tax=Henosepilachna vigintioctopunctata TaxID=420089 RepID=A0AAW1UTG6_9CUCU
MSIAPQNRQNEYKMSNHRYRSNGLADTKLSETNSKTRTQQTHTDEPKPSQSHENPPPPFESTKGSQDGPISKEPPHKSPDKTPEGSIKKETSNITVNTSEISQTTQKEERDFSKLPDCKTSSHSKVEQPQIISYEEEAMNKIEKITQDIEEMYNKMHNLEKFKHMSEFKMYEEFFLQKNIELDNIDPKNNESIREFRKAAVKYVQDCMHNLDQKHKISTY